jgi:hypothetical protein
MQQPSTVRGSAAKLFRHPPEYIAQEITKQWHAEHPEWTADDVIFTYDFLREIYRQARAWWLTHPKATEDDLRKMYHETVKAHLRGERLIPIPGSRQKARSATDRQAEHDALWNCFSPAEKADLEYRSWHVSERARGRKPTPAEKQATYESLLRKHLREPSSSNPVSSDFLGRY